MTDTMMEHFKQKSLKRIKDIEQAHKDAGNSTLSFPDSKPITFPPTETVVIPEDHITRIHAAMKDMFCCKGCGGDLSRSSRFSDKKLCWKCEEIEKKKLKQEWLDQQKELTIEERLANIEEFIYWYKNVDHRDPFSIHMR